MSKIFRLHKGLTQNIEHWQKLPSYIDHYTIDSIDDPSGLTASTQITSIPTPFARMDLVKSAFLFVTKSGNLDGNTIYHKIVSDTLDVAELFFNIDAFRDKVEILEWNSGIHMNGGEVSVSNESDLGVLLNSNNPKHKLLGDTLKMFLIQDSEHFNFSKLNHLYFLNYKNGPDRLNIIGGTSPNSIFFPSSNNLSFVDISIKGYKLFDPYFNPLKNRDPDFIKWLYLIEQLFPNFSTLFKGFKDYLKITLSALPKDLAVEVKAYNFSNASDYYNSNYNSITINDAGNDIELLSNILKGKKYKDVEVSVEDNDFIINAKKSVIGKIPAVFPLDAFNGNLSFAGTLWQKDWFKNVPKFDPKPIEERTLPNQVHIKYPYLTVDDLFEPYILRVPYEIDSTKFFNGNYKRKSNSKVHDFILPLKPKILEYFSAVDLTLTLSDGSKMFELIEIPNGVKAILRVPVKKNTNIQFQREYFNNTSIDSIPPYDENSNQGFIIDSLFTLAIYPFIKLPIDINPHYRVLLVDKDILPLSKTHNFSLSFHSNSIDKSIQFKQKIKRSDKTQSPKVSTDYYVIESDFDFIQLNHTLYQNSLVIPYPTTYDAIKSNKKYKFAIDFGTTNTHIEFIDEVGGNPKPFEILDNEIQIATLINKNAESLTRLRQDPNLGQAAINIVNIVLEELIPEIIGGKSDFSFPQRTIINDNGRFSTDISTYSLSDFNIPFWYLKENYELNSVLTSNLKWLDFNKDKKSEKRTKGYIKQLLLMIRNKVLVNGGDLNETEIVWFYPSSMPKDRKRNFELSWIEYVDRYFNNSKKLHKLSESFAPFYYYYHVKGVRPYDRPGVNIDIGGGTTDIVVFKGDKPDLLTSFRFASNSIFGDGYGLSSIDNGFVQEFKDNIINTLKNVNARSLLNIYDKISSKNNSIELCEFFFSLEENKFIKENNIDVSFSKMILKNSDFKLVFIIFYSAIIYHITKLMKLKNYQKPQYITFSGNGAKLVKIANGGADLNNKKSSSSLIDLSKLLINSVYESNEDFDIEFEMFNQPKEITCKGGISIKSDKYDELDSLEKKITSVLSGVDDIVLDSNKDQTDNSSTLTYKEIQSENTYSSVDREVNNFIDLFFSLNSKISFKDEFGINPKNLDDYKTAVKKNIKNDLISGVKNKISEVSDSIESNIEETLFFYPLIGSLNRLANTIHLKNKD